MSHLVVELEARGLERMEPYQLATMQREQKLLCCVRYNVWEMSAQQMLRNVRKIERESGANMRFYVLEQGSPWITIC